ELPAAGDHGAERGRVRRGRPVVRVRGEARQHCHPSPGEARNEDGRRRRGAGGTDSRDEGGERRAPETLRGREGHADPRSKESGGGTRRRGQEMKISVTSIERPVLATVMSLAILLFGIIAFTRLPVREYPDIDPPIISVVTIYRGANPNVVETEITNILEEQFATLEGVKTMSSSSREQGSVITIEFELNRDVDEAANEVRDRVSRIRGQLPREVDDPIVSKVDANAQAIVWIALYSDRHSGLE